MSVRRSTCRACRAWVNALQSKKMLLLVKADWAGDLRNARASVKEGLRQHRDDGQDRGDHRADGSRERRLQQQVAVLQGLTEEELRALARRAADAEIARPMLRIGSP
jgi:hypothetical protein